MAQIVYIHIYNIRRYSNRLAHITLAILLRQPCDPTTFD